MPDAVELLNTFGNGDPAIEAADFDNQRVKLSNGRFTSGRSIPLNHEGQDLKAFLIENQGVCWWAFSLDSDDPPVFCSYTPETGPWIQVADSFSLFVYCRLFDFRHFCEEGLFHMEVTDAVPESTLSYLRAHFSPGPASRHIEGWSEHRFQRNDMRVTVSGQTWFLSADSPIAFDQLAMELRPFLEEL